MPWESLCFEHCKQRHYFCSGHWHGAMTISLTTLAINGSYVTLGMTRCHSVEYHYADCHVFVLGVVMLNLHQQLMFPGIGKNLLLKKSSLFLRIFGTHISCYNYLHKHTLNDD
jgi:hypothetical protein